MVCFSLSFLWKAGENTLDEKKLFFISVLFTFFCTEGFTADLQVVVLDVGMDQSILLAEEGQGLLVDTGLAEYGPHVLSRIKDHGVETLDYLILSHLQPDHAGGYFQIRAAWPDTPVFTTCTIPQHNSILLSRRRY